MVIVVAGGTGYLGSKIVIKLIENNFDVICIKNATSNISKLSKYDKVKFINSDAKNLEELFKNNDVECVINTVCKYNGSNIMDIDIVASNLFFPITLLSTYVNFNKRKQYNFITIDTGLNENINIYAYSKKMFSDYGKYYTNKYPVNFYNIILENFYGCDEPKDRFLHRCISMMKKNEPIDLTSGMQRRDFIHIDDVVNGIFLILKKRYELSKYIDIPLGSGQAPTIKEVMYYLKEQMHSASSLNFGAIPDRICEDDCIADLSIINELGFKLKYYWKDGIKQLIN